MIKEEKNLYELGFVLKEEDSAGVKRLLEKHSAEAVQPGPVVKVNLAYPIKKNSQAFFGYIRFEMAGASAVELAKEIKSDVSVLRSLLIKAPRPGAETGQPAEAAAAPKPPFKSFLRPRKSPVAAPGPVLTNEALEKKIEEILK